MTFPAALAACGGGHIHVPGVALVEYHGLQRERSSMKNSYATIDVAADDKVLMKQSVLYH